MRKLFLPVMIGLVLLSSMPLCLADDESPSPRMGASMIYDPVNKQVLLFGGAKWENRYTLFNDLWSYKYETNTWTKVETTLKPGGRFNTAMVYDPDAHQIILFSGFGANERQSDLWIYGIAENEWTRKYPENMPSARSSPAMVYDAKNRKVILFDGYVHLNDTHPNDTWAYDIAENTWTKMQPETSPKPQYGHYFIYDIRNEKILMMGGHWVQSRIIHGYTDGLWEYDYETNTWTQIDEDPDPPGRYWHTLTYNSRSGEMIVFSGSQGGNGMLGDTWTYNIASQEWTEITSSTGPPARSCSSSVYDPENDVVLIFGGSFLADNTYFDDLWALDSEGEWTQLTGTRMVSNDPPTDDISSQIPGYPLWSILLGLILISTLLQHKSLVPPPTR